jgi:hypothetical protein
MTAPAQGTRRSDTQSGLWPNRQLSLLLTAAIGEDTQAAEAFCRWRESVDLEADFDHGSYLLLPLVYQHMHRLGIRDPLMGRLKGVYRMSWCENQVVFDKAQRLVSHLEQSGITTLLLNGIVLAVSYYCSFPARPVAAVDIAVASSQIRHSIALIEAFGWRANTRPSAEDLKYQFSMRFTDSNGVELDLHWHFLNELCNDDADAFFWSSATPLDFRGVPTLQLDPTATLLHVILRGIRGNGDPPSRWISDAFSILKHQSGRFDWERMIAIAQSQQLTCSLGLGLGYLTEQHNAPVPSDVLTRLRQIRPSLIERIENKVVFHTRRRFDANPLIKQWMIVIDFCRCTTATGPIEFLLGLSQYIRYRWGLERRRDLIAAIPRGLMRRIGKIWL